MELPAPLLSVAQMRALEARALATAGTEALVLMRRAAAASLQALRAHWPEARSFTVLCGGGNNGGDGWMVARLGREAGFDARVVWTTAPDALRGEASQAAAEALAAGVPADAFAGSATGTLSRAEVIVDALLGIGLSAPVRAPLVAAIEAINAAGRPVLALDVPSGLCADSGRVQGVAVRADATVSFIALKAGLLLGAGPDHAGALSVDSLGVEPPRAHEIAWQRITRAQLRASIPRRRRDAHKGQGGHVFVVGGGEGMPGAARLAGEAALRVGAGRVTVVCAESSATAIAASRPELMVRSLGGDAAAVAARASEWFTAADVIVFGPGLGRDLWARRMLDAVRASGKPTVFDADALQLLALQLLDDGRDDGLPAESVLTPHPGEAAAMLGLTSATVQADRPAALRALIDRHAAVVVLKGAGTLIGQRGRVPQICDRGHPVLAAPGTGDVLAGAIGGLWAQIGDVWAATTSAVWVHARAGERLAHTVDRGVLAGEVAAALPLALAEAMSADTIAVGAMAAGAAS
jgi:hydroxyethylthiazole kinase-like uncharacterized protein yjeF